MPQVIRNIYFIFGMFFCSYEQDTDKYPRRQGKRADRVPILSNKGACPLVAFDRIGISFAESCFCRSGI